jgi:hypothetical protein
MEWSVAQAGQRPVGFHLSIHRKQTDGNSIHALHVASKLSTLTRGSWDVNLHHVQGVLCLQLCPIHTSLPVDLTPG